MPDITLKNDDKSISLQKKIQSITIQHTSAPYIVQSNQSNDYNDLLNKPDLSVYATKIYVDDELAGKAELVHVHTISSVTGLQSALDSKSATNHTHTAANVTDFDTEVSNNTDVVANTAARHTHANAAALNLVSGTNTGDNAVNSNYSGLAASKQDTLVSGTNIKTINGTSVLGSGDIAITGAVGSVNAQTGAVVLDADDISDTATTNKFVTSAEKTKLSNLSGTNTGDNLFIGTTTPTPSTGAQVLWLDTTGGNITLNLVTGD